MSFEGSFGYNRKGGVAGSLQGLRRGTLFSTFFALLIGKLIYFSPCLELSVLFLENII